MKKKKEKEKKYLFVISIVSFLIVLAAIVSYFCFFQRESFINDYDYLYNEAITFLENNSKDYTKEENDFKLFYSYEKLGISEDRNYKYAYLWILEESYYVKNNKVELGNSSSRPYKFTFKDDKVIKEEIPQDGSYYKKSLKKIFPWKIRVKMNFLDLDKLKTENNRKRAQYYDYLDNNINYNDDSKEILTLKEKNNCVLKKELYYKDDISIYSVCLEKIEINFNNKKWELKDYLDYTDKKSSEVMSDIIEMIEENDKDNVQKVMYKDGGTIKLIKDNYNILKCQTIDGNKDIYIGKELDYMC